jgi:hypothetical protein
VGPLLRLVQVEAGPAHHDLLPVRDVVIDHQLQRERVGTVPHERKHVRAEGRLHLRVLEELVQDDAGLGVALQLDDHAHPVPVRLVPKVRDAVERSFLHEVRDLLEEAALRDHVGDLGDDDRLAVLLVFLDRRRGADRYVAAPRGVAVHDPLTPVDDGAGREIGALHDAKQVLDAARGVVDDVVDGVDDLAQVVRRDVRGHADRDAGGPVEEQVGDGGRKHDGFLAGLVVVRPHVDRFLLHVAEHLLRELGQPGFCVSLGRRSVAVHRPEVPLPVHERVAHREGLGQAYHRLVDGGRAVRVVVTGDVPGDLGGLSEGPVVEQVQLAHRDEDAAVHGLQSIADVRERARDDDRHRIVDVRIAHLVFDVDRNDFLARGHAANGPPCPWTLAVDQTSRLRTLSAYSSMNLRRGSTWSPIKIVNIRSASTKSSSVTL